ncbi:hypothetical protein L6452_31922 [Arctium lappa]|uniref:Uncharacterized protein n=1 Tax=Arctium lappa TaxID=4217 RepID=A0ACB8Z3D3_ARCLA|nr:hypothetical protein L6452_31922 [Arctium lappa]
MDQNSLSFDLNRAPDHHSHCQIPRFLHPIAVKVTASNVCFVLHWHHYNLKPKGLLRYSSPCATSMHIWRRCNYVKHVQAITCVAHVRRGSNNVSRCALRLFVNENISIILCGWKLIHIAVRISVHGGYLTSSPSVRFSIDHRHKSPGHSVAASSSRNLNRNCDRDGNKKAWSHGSKKTCLCSPTTHPGSFRCSLHKNSSMTNSNDSHDSTVTYRSHRLYAQRSAMTNSLVRIGTVEGDLVKRALAALIRPSSHQQRRRSDFQPRPSRLSVMSKADE